MRYVCRKSEKTQKISQNLTEIEYQNLFKHNLKCRFPLRGERWSAYFIFLISTLISNNASISALIPQSLDINTN